MSQCWKIHVRNDIRAWTKRRSNRLNLPSHAYMRYACSVQGDGDLTMTKFNKFWKQGKLPVGTALITSRVILLGGLEFIVDICKE